MKKFIIIFAFLAPLLARGQSVDTAVHKGSILTLGTGSAPNGEFVYIFTNSFKMPANYNGLKGTVTTVGRMGSKRAGYKPRLIINVGGLLGRYYVDLDGALKAGEITAIDGVPVASVNSREDDGQTDKATRLLEWKKALDQGAISQYEYDSIKSAILHE